MFEKIKKALKLSYTNKEGYKQIYQPKNPNANKDGYVAEHRYIAATTAKTHLDSKNIVHHIDGNKKNNKPDNLQITTKKEHFKIHHGKKGFKR